MDDHGLVDWNPWWLGDPPFLRTPPYCYVMFSLQKDIYLSPAFISHVGWSLKLGLWISSHIAVYGTNLFMFDANIKTTEYYIYSMYIVIYMYIYIFIMIVLYLDPQSKYPQHREEMAGWTNRNIWGFYVYYSTYIYIFMCVHYSMEELEGPASLLEKTC